MHRLIFIVCSVILIFKAFAAPEILFSDDFSQVNTKWVNGKQGNIIKGSYKLGGQKGSKLVCIKAGQAWKDYTVDFDVIEQVTLARNRVQHPEDLTDLRVNHSENDLKRFPNPFFANETEIAMAIHDDDDSVTWWLKPLVKPTREENLAAIDQVEALCCWLEEEYWKWESYQ